MSTTMCDLEHASAEEVLRYGVERFGSRLTVACSFQKEESVLLGMLAEIVRGRGGGPDSIRAFVIDTGVLFPETMETWQRFRDHWPEVRFDVIDASSPDTPWTQSNCCSAAKVAGLEQALSDDVDAWVTGLRREQAPTRSQTPKLDRDEARGLWKLSPLADWTEKDLWRHIAAHDLPYNPLHDEGYDSIGCAPCTLPGSGREGRWAGEDKTECGIHVVEG